MIFVTRNTRIEPEIQTRVRVKTYKGGWIMVERLSPLHSRHNHLAGGCDYQATPGK